MKLSELNRVQDLRLRLGYLQQYLEKIIGAESARIGDVTFTTKDLEPWKGVQITQGVMCQFRANARDAIQRRIDAARSELKTLGVEVDA